MIDIDEIIDESSNKKKKHSENQPNLNDLKKLKKYSLRKIDLSLFFNYFLSWLTMFAFTVLILSIINILNSNPECDGSMLTSENLINAMQSMVSGSELLFFMVTTTMITLVEFFSRNTRRASQVSIILGSFLVFAFGLVIYGLEVTEVVTNPIGNKEYFFTLNLTYGIVWFVVCILCNLVLSTKNDES